MTTLKKGVIMGILTYGLKVVEVCYDCGERWEVCYLQGPEKDFDPANKDVYCECPHGHRGGHRPIEEVNFPV
jgi:hypothetical protein